MLDFIRWLGTSGTSQFGKPQCAVMRAAAMCTTSSAMFIDAETLQLPESIFGISVK